jgi:UDP-MurNAc hydroxylase
MACIAVRYIYSACVVIKTPDQKILCDPWFTEGIYDGSWYHYPRVEDPLNLIGDIDSIYISHIHPDHYDPRFILSYFERYGKKLVLIPDHAPNFLLKKMALDGISATVVEKNQKLRIGSTSIQIMPAETGSISDIDSALIVKFETAQKTHCVVNANDIIFNDELIENLKRIAGKTDILLCGYTGAGPYPQTYFELNDPILFAEAQKKKESFFKRYRKLTRSINATVNIPFAGKYLLGGKLAILNSVRGVADPVEVLDFDESAVVLADQGGSIETCSFVPNGIRTSCYDESDIDRRVKEISRVKMKYEQLIPENEISQLPIKRLVFTAYINALKKSEVETDYFFVLSLGQQRIVINANKNAQPKVDVISDNDTLPLPRSEITIDPRYLFGLLTGVYHWNNAEVGSQFSVRRTPNVFNRSAQGFLNFLSIV